MADAISTVEYRDIPDFPGYRAGSDGTIWSCRLPGSPYMKDRWAIRKGLLEVSAGSANQKTQSAVERRLRMGATAYYPPYIGAAKITCARCGSECPGADEPCPKCSTEEPGMVGEHNWQFACSFGQDAPNQSLDSIFHCPRCGAVRHDYAHNGGQQSPNYPTYLTPGVSGWQAGEPECRRV